MLDEKPKIKIGLTTTILRKKRAAAETTIATISIMIEHQIQNFEC